MAERSNRVGIRNSLSSWVGVRVWKSESRRMTEASCLGWMGRRRINANWTLSIRNKVINPANVSIRRFLLSPSSQARGYTHVYYFRTWGTPMNYDGATRPKQDLSAFCSLYSMLLGKRTICLQARGSRQIEPVLLFLPCGSILSMRPNIFMFIV